MGIEDQDRITHVNAKKPKSKAMGSFNRAFLQAHKAPVALIAHNPPRKKDNGVTYGFASGVLISPFYLLTAAHPFDKASIEYLDFEPKQNVVIDFHYEYTQATADAQVKVIETSRAKAIIEEEVERGSQYDVDYMILRIKFTEGVLPTPARINASRLNWENSVYYPGQFLNHELMCLQHPYGMPTMASAGQVVKINQNPYSRLDQGLEDKMYCYLYSAAGSSGAPVFDKDGRVVALLIGSTDSRDGPYSTVLDMGAIWRKSQIVRDIVETYMFS